MKLIPNKEITTQLSGDSQLLQNCRNIIENNKTKSLTPVESQLLVKADNTRVVVADDTQSDIIGEIFNADVSSRCQ